MGDLVRQLDPATVGPSQFRISTTGNRVISPDVTVAQMSSGESTPIYNGPNVILLLVKVKVFCWQTKPSCPFSLDTRLKPIERDSEWSQCSALVSKVNCSKHPKPFSNERGFYSPVWRGLCKPQAAKTTQPLRCHSPCLHGAKVGIGRVFMGGPRKCWFFLLGSC